MEDQSLHNGPVRPLHERLSTMIPRVTSLHDHPSSLHEFSHVAHEVSPCIHHKGVRPPQPARVNPLKGYRFLSTFLRGDRREALQIIQSKFYEFDLLNSPFAARLDEDGNVWVRLTSRRDNKEHLLIDRYGKIKYGGLPDAIKIALGVDSETALKRNDEIKTQLKESNQVNKELRSALAGLRAVVDTGDLEIQRYSDNEKELRRIIDEHQQRIAEGESSLDAAVKQKIQAKTESEKLFNELRQYKDELDKSKKGLSSLKKVEQSRDRLLKRVNELEELANKQINSNEEQINDLERQNEAIRERMSLRDRVKAIFKKYGFTVFSVVSAVSVVIGVIVSNLSKGLSKLGSGVGNGLKTIGKKLGEILPGMVGAIVSFLFKTAGEVISFLGKNAWLLIVAVVVYFVENLKKKNR